MMVPNHKGHGYLNNGKSFIADGYHFGIISFLLPAPITYRDPYNNYNSSKREKFLPKL